jgi:hypothetical protein
MLSHAVMRVVQVFPSFLMLSLACVFVRVVGLPSVKMWLDHGEDRCCGLSKVGLMETVGFRQVMWLVMLESAKDRVSGVDPPGQHVPPRVRCGTACWLIRKALVSLSCGKCGTGIAIPTRPQGARGVRGYRVIPNREKPLQLWKGPEGTEWYPTGGNLWQSKTNDLGLTFVKACSVLWAIHQRKCKEWQKGGSLVAWQAMKSRRMGTGYNLCRVYNYHDSRACGYKRSGILFWLDGLDRDGMDLVKTLWDLCDTLSLCGHTYA